ncbi:cardiolipin synthase (CMP-forming) isoform X2 [Pleurodeles waltl]|uniref:cardiolipin synthase (CMP-forming) isoform X2 n=1 Tax=Pleurodeles waltl TaxID=8319 RepID=UPI00370979A5
MLAAGRGWRAALQCVKIAASGPRRQRSAALGVEGTWRSPLAAGSPLLCCALCPTVPRHRSLQWRLCSSDPSPESQNRVRSTAKNRASHAEGAAESTAPPSGSDSRGFSELYENPWTIPNLLSMTRIGLSPVLGYLIVQEDFNVALGVFTLAGVTDLLDGYIARNWANQKSVLGSALDPLADKILISILYVSLTYTGLIPVPLTAMIVLRDIVLIAAVFYVRYQTLPPPKTISRYFNPCYATAQLKPTFISKVHHCVHHRRICIQLLPLWTRNCERFKEVKI